MLDALLPARGSAHHDRPEPGTAWRGTIARDPGADGVRVTLDGYGPQMFTARYREADTPVEGDACLVVFDDQLDPWVVVVWA